MVLKVYHWFWQGQLNLKFAGVEDNDEMLHGCQYAVGDFTVGFKVLHNKMEQLVLTDMKLLNMVSHITLTKTFQYHTCSRR